MLCKHVVYVCKSEMSKQKLDPLSQRNSSFAASREVWKYIKDSGITTVSWCCRWQWWRNECDYCDLHLVI